MTKLRTIKFLFLVLISAQASGQKIKYKDVFGLLSTKQYDAAEPFLRTYLKSNDDNPNAYLFMGLIYQEKSEKDDILKETNVAVQHMDSAVMYFEKAKAGVTEKEIRRNKEYYIAYNRRDLRTGEYGVTLSDVQLDLDNRVNALRERIDKVKMTSHYFNDANEFYKRSNDMYLAIQKAFPGIRELYLRSDDEMLDNLQKLADCYDSCAKAFSFYKTSLSNLGKTKYNQKWMPKEIKDFKKDGKEMVSFFSDEVDVWDYKKFADGAREFIVKEVRPIQESLVQHDMKINKLRDILENDSIPVGGELSMVEDELADNTLRKFDENPLPLDVFALKIAELKYKSVLVQNAKTRDSTDVYYQLSRAEAKTSSARALDSVSSRLSNRNIEEEAANYNEFVKNTYSKVGILKSYIRSLGEYAQREKVISEMELSRRRNALRWLMLENDSIPLFKEENNTPFKPMLIENDYTAGISFKSGGALGYFYTISPSHVPKVRVTYPVDKNDFTLETLQEIKPMVTTDPNGQIFYLAYVLTRPINEKYPVTFTKIYKSDGLSWSIDVMMDFVPAELFLRSDTGELVVKSQNDTNIVIDKNGKVIQ